MLEGFCWHETPLEKLQKVALVFAEHKLAPREVAHLLKHMDGSTQRYDAALYFLFSHFLEGLENIPRVAISDGTENHQRFLVCERRDRVEVGKSQVQP